MAKLDKSLTRKEMHPISMRVTGLQYERLVKARARDGLSLQEHSRRALDFYLAHLEKSVSEPVALGRSAVPAVPPGILAGAASKVSTKRASPPKVARR